MSNKETTSVDTLADQVKALVSEVVWSRGVANRAREVLEAWTGRAADVGDRMAALDKAIRLSHDEATIAMSEELARARTDAARTANTCVKVTVEKGRLERELQIVNGKLEAALDRAEKAEDDMAIARQTIAEINNEIGRINVGADGAVERW